MDENLKNRLTSGWFQFLEMKFLSAIKPNSSNSMSCNLAYKSTLSTAGICLRDNDLLLSVLRPPVRFFPHQFPYENIPGFSTV